MDQIQNLIFDPAFGDSSTSCSEEDSSDGSDSEYDLSDSEVGMKQNSSDSGSRCSELEELFEDTDTSNPNAAHSTPSDDENVVEMQKQGVIQGRGRRRGRGRGRGLSERQG